MKFKYDNSKLKELRKTWRTVEISCLEDDEKKIFLDRKKAVDMYIDNFSIDKINELTNIKGRSEPKRLLLKCLTLDNNGIYLGYTALLKYKRIANSYQRKNITSSLNVNENNNCNTGMFMYLLTEYPQLKEYIDFLYFGKIKTTLEKNIKTLKIHELFIKKCRELGIKEYEYPFNVNSKGQRSLYRYIKSLEYKEIDQYSNRLSNTTINKLKSTGIKQTILLPELRPFSCVQIDGHKIDCITTIEITNTKGDIERKTIQRFWLLTIIDVATRAILGYHITVKSAYDRFDVLKCIDNAIQPKKILKLTIPDLEYPSNFGFHSIAIPETQWAVFDEIMLDNALAHLSHTVIDKITTYLKATINFGPVSSPERRGSIERFYQTIESRGFHRLVSTTGSGVNDTRRIGAEKDAIKYGIKFEHICELTEILIAQYNNTPHSAINGFSPLEIMEQRLNKGLIPNYIEKEMRNKFMLNFITVTRRICGKLGTGRRPYITFEGAEYRSDILSKSFELVGRKLILRFNPDDIRTCKAFFEDGSEFCDLCVIGSWRNYPHTLTQRKSANKLLNEKKLKENTFIDPIETYDKYLLNESITSKRARNKLADRRITNTINIDKEANCITTESTKKTQFESSNVFSLDELENHFKNLNNKIQY